MKTPVEQLSEQFAKMSSIATTSQKIAESALDQRDEAREALRYCRSQLGMVCYELGAGNTHQAVNQISACIDKIDETLGGKP